MGAVELERLMVRLTMDASGYNTVMRQAEGRLMQFANSVYNVGRAISLGMMAPLVGVGYASVRAFASFDKAMNHSIVTMGDVSEQTRKVMEQHALTISNRGIVPAYQLAEAYGVLAASGLTARQQIAALGTVERLAIAGTMDAAVAARHLAAIQTGMGMAAADTEKNFLNIANVLALLRRESGGAQVEGLAHGLARVAPTLRLLNVDLAHGAAALAVFARQERDGTLGAQNMQLALIALERSANAAEVALQRRPIREPAVHGALLQVHRGHAGAMQGRMGGGTVLRDDIRDWNHWGLTIYDAHKKLLPLSNIIGQLERRMAGMNGQEQAMFMQSIGIESRVVRFMGPLIGMSGELRRLEKEFGNVRDIINEMAEREMKSFSGQWQVLWNNMRNIGIEIGGHLAPWLMEINQLLKQAGEWWRSLDPAIRKAIAVTLLFVAATGPLLLVLGGLNRYILFILATIGAFVSSVVMIPIHIAALAISLTFAAARFIVAAASITWFALRLATIPFIITFRLLGLLGLGLSRVTILMRALGFVLGVVISPLVVVIGLFDMLGGFVSRALYNLFGFRLMMSSLRYVLLPLITLRLLLTSLATIPAFSGLVYILRTVASYTSMVTVRLGALILALTSPIFARFVGLIQTAASFIARFGYTVYSITLRPLIAQLVALSMAFWNLVSARIPILGLFMSLAVTITSLLIRGIAMLVPMVSRSLYFLINNLTLLAAGLQILVGIYFSAFINALQVGFGMLMAFGASVVYVARNALPWLVSAVVQFGEMVERAFMAGLRSSLAFMGSLLITGRAMVLFAVRYVTVLTSSLFALGWRAIPFVILSLGYLVFSLIRTAARFGMLAIEAVVSAVAAMWNFIFAVMGSLAPIGQMIVGLGHLIWNFLTLAGSALMNAIAAIWQVVVSFGAALVSMAPMLILIPLLIAAFIALSVVVVNVVLAIGSAFVGLFSIVTGVMSGLYTVIAGGFVGMFAGAGQAVDDFLAGIPGFLDNFQENMGRLFTWFRANWRSIWTDVTELARRSGSALASIVGELLRHLSAIFTVWSFNVRQQMAAALNPFGSEAQLLDLESSIANSMRIFGERVRRIVAEEFSGFEFETPAFGGFNLARRLEERPTDMDALMRRVNDLRRGETPDVAGFGRGVGDTFKEISLKRFELEGPGGLARGADRRPKVDTGLDDYLRDIRDNTRPRPITAGR